MNEANFDVPILFIIFNRLDCEQQVFDKIREIKPKKLYISADAPRPDVMGDKEKSDEARSIINQIDWNCELHTRFLDKNLGCAIGVSSAISWFFDTETEGIILEDDCVPHKDFFQYCKILLEKYHNDSNVMCISGSTADDSECCKPQTSYTFIKFTNIWGWATWKRAWNLYDIKLPKWNNFSKKLLKDPYYNQVPFYREYIQQIGDKYHTTKYPDTWDWQWQITIMMCNGYCIAPRENMISNVGLNGTHINDNDLNNHPELYRKTHSFNFENVLHPEKIELDRKVDIYICQKIDRSFLNGSFVKKTIKIVLLKITIIMRKMHLLPALDKILSLAKSRV